MYRAVFRDHDDTQQERSFDRLGEAMMFAQGAADYTGRRARVVQVFERPGFFTPEITIQTFEPCRVRLSLGQT